MYTKHFVGLKIIFNNYISSW